MSWGTDSSHWIANCHKSCKMIFAITMTGHRRPRGSNNLATSENMTRFDTTWGSVSRLQRNWNVSWHWFHYMPRIHEFTALSLIMTGKRSRLSVSNNSGQFEAHLLNSNAPNFNSWMVSSRISFNSSTVFRSGEHVIDIKISKDACWTARELMSVLFGQMLKASGSQECGSCIVSDDSEFVRIDISRRIVAPENSLQARLRWMH